MKFLLRWFWRRQRLLDELDRQKLRTKSMQRMWETMCEERDAFRKDCTVKDKAISALRHKLANKLQVIICHEAVAEMQEEALAAKDDRIRGLLDENSHLNSLICDECADAEGRATGWCENRVEGRYPCVCLTETEAWQEREALIGRLTEELRTTIDQIPPGLCEGVWWGLNDRGPEYVFLDGKWHDYIDGMLDPETFRKELDGIFVNYLGVGKGESCCPDCGGGGLVPDELTGWPKSCRKCEAKR